MQHARLVSAAAWMLNNVREWQGDGLWTPEAYLRWRTGISHTTAIKVVAIAKRAGEFPHCIEAMERGGLSVDQMVPVAKHAPAWCDQQMAGLAPHLSVAQVSKTAREYPWDYDLSPAGQGSNASGADGPESESAEVHIDTAELATPHTAPDEAWYGWDDNGRFRLSANLSADSGGILETALIEARDTLFNAASQTSTPPTP